MKRVAILGSTGSIGRQALDVVRALPGRFEVAALAAGSNVGLLASQVAEFRPKMVYHRGGNGDIELGSGCRLVEMDEMAIHPDIDLVVVATSGNAGLEPTLSALSAGKKVALANKEALVVAGHLLVNAVKEYGGTIHPIDSEHSAVWQCLRGEIDGFKCCSQDAGNEMGPFGVERIILTASGGALRHLDEKELAAVTPEQALSHPVWVMGKKVTIDSATLMNKGLEVIEAHWLFGIPYSRIETVVHFEGIVHSMVEFVDGSVKAQLGSPDMRLPIQYALLYPERLENPQVPRLDFTTLGLFTFSKPDYRRFPCLELAIKAGARGGTYPAVLCATDEVAVSRFLDGEIGFASIPSLVEDILSRHTSVDKPSLEEIRSAEEWAREEATHWVSR